MIVNYPMNHEMCLNRYHRRILQPSYIVKLKSKSFWLNQKSELVSFFLFLFKLHTINSLTTFIKDTCSYLYQQFSPVWQDFLSFTRLDKNWQYADVYWLFKNSCEKTYLLFIVNFFNDSRRFPPYIIWNLSLNDKD